jgi:hypothetical protein
MSDILLDYEHLREQLENLAQPKREADRKTLWVVDRLLGIATTTAGSIEVFLVGARLNAFSGLVRRHLEHDRWEIAEAGILIEANRIALPGEPHFISLAAVIGIELFRCGFTTSENLPRAFRQVEPLIELALRRTALAEEHILGLVGELLCLEVMLDSTTDASRYSSILDMWRGHTSARDFVINKSGIEVKTTQLLNSSHKFSGLHQIEPPAESLNSESTVYLLSVGLTASEIEGQSLSEIVDRVLRRFNLDTVSKPSSWTPLQRRFVGEVAAYGSANSVGYNHESMAGERIYNARWKPTFTPRLYDLSDPDMRILRRHDLEATHVSPDDLQFRLDLDASISASNPVSNWAQAITHMVRAALSQEEK